ncbi:MAG: hypothetical protein BGN88_00080 [Clostridiales bacterium 43-6]|nr:MAG: hypothetical protein BGN88_00080 [Clostridiales bacterium 43-6]
MNMFAIPSDILEMSNEAIRLCKDSFLKAEEITEYNQQKVLKAFIDERVSESHFAASTGYGYGDRGRETLERVFARIMGAEDALIRHSFVSGTHALTVALFGVLRPGDKVLAVTGKPYDTIQPVFGLSPASGSLKEFGVMYDEIILKNNHVDIPAMTEYLNNQTVKMVYIQRSRGYTLRPSLFVSQIGEIIKTVKATSPQTIVMVDNCYGEFVDTIEPTDVGADLMAGSLIKNPGGGIAPTGGYIAGRRDLVEMCANRMTTPGIGREVGATLGHSRELFMGLFHAPHVTGEAVKTAIYAAALFEKCGYDVAPKYTQPRGDIIQSVCLKEPNALIAFCQGIQSGAPVDAFVVPEPWDMPGYDSKVIMAAGAFTMGASIELSADAPLREPYAAFMQGGLNFHSSKAAILLAVKKLMEQGFINRT